MGSVLGSPNFGKLVILLSNISCGLRDLLVVRNGGMNPFAFSIFCKAPEDKAASSRPFFYSIQTKNITRMNNLNPLPCDRAKLWVL